MNTIVLGKMLASLMTYTLIGALRHQGVGQVQSSRSQICDRIPTSNRGLRNLLPLAAGLNTFTGDVSMIADSGTSLADKKLSGNDTPVKFDISLAVILAGYSFEAYNEPVRMRTTRVDHELYNFLLKCMTDALCN